MRFTRAVAQTRFTKTPDRNSVIWFHKSIGCWTFMLTTLYVADMYGQIGSDGNEVKLVVIRNPRFV